MGCTGVAWVTFVQLSSRIESSFHQGSKQTSPKDESAETGFRWSLTLVAKILVRTILEGVAAVLWVPPLHPYTPSIWKIFTYITTFSTTRNVYIYYTFLCESQAVVSCFHPPRVV